MTTSTSVLQSEQPEDEITLMTHVAGLCKNVLTKTIIKDVPTELLTTFNQ